MQHVFGRTFTSRRGNAVKQTIAYLSLISSLISSPSFAAALPSSKTLESPALSSYSWLGRVSASFALPYFSIEPVSLPAHITTGSSAVASYIITNNTGIALKGIGVKNLISGVVSQDTTSVGPLSPAVCTNPITLTASGSKASCLLQIKVLNHIAHWLPEVCDSLQNPIYCSQPKKLYELTVIRYITFEKAVYDDKACKTLAGPPILIDSGKYCNPYAYSLVPIN